MAVLREADAEDAPSLGRTLAARTLSEQSRGMGIAIENFGELLQVLCMQLKRT